jgi:hypothetical protein
LIEQQQVRRVELTQLSIQDVEKRDLQNNRANPHLLAWLWDVIAKPVLNELGHTNIPLADNWPRV